MSKLQESGENYLETILILQNGGRQVRSIDIANELGYTKPSISRAVGILKSNNYIDVDDSGYITLTKKGEDLAKTMYERHQLITNFFIKLGVNLKTAAADACRVEHVISEETFEKLKLYYDAIK